MDQIIYKYQNVLKNLLPASVLSDVKCFVLYDHHPMDQRQLDITICSGSEVREYFQRELVSSIQIPKEIPKAVNIRIIRNSKCELYYLVTCPDDVFILSSNKRHIALHNHTPFVTSLTMDDPNCTGKVTLMLTLGHDAIPIIFNDKLEVLGQDFNLSQTSDEFRESTSLFKQLSIKLNEAIYITKHNEQTLDEYIKIKQLAAFSMYQKLKCAPDDADINLSLKTVTNALQVYTEGPIVKICNKKLVLILKIDNRNAEPMQHVHILVHGSSLPSKSYTTRIFNKITSSPYLKEIDSHIECNQNAVVTATIDLDELKYNVTSRLDFDAVLSYKRNDEIYLLPFKSVSISAMDTMGEKFDILTCNTDYGTMLVAIMATSQKVDLKLRQVKNASEASIIPSDIFHKHLEMCSAPNYINVAIHNKSPFHILHGLMVIYDGNLIQGHTLNIEVYTRQPSQVLALIHYMYEKVPHRIIATTSDFILKPIVDAYNLPNFKEEDECELDCTNYAKYILEQIEIIETYLKECAENMEKTGAHTDNKIDLKALGIETYLKFKDNLQKKLQANKDLIKKKK